MISRFAQTPIGQFVIINIAVIAVLIPIFIQYQRYQDNQAADAQLTREAEAILNRFLHAAPESVALMEAQLAAGADLERFRVELSEPERYDAVRTRLISRLRRQKSRVAQTPDVEVEPRKLGDIVSALGKQAGEPRRRGD